MNNEGTVAPDNSAQATVVTDDPASPPNDGAQEPLDSSQAQPPVVDDQSAGDAGTPTAEPEPQTSTPEPEPYWKTEGFNSEEEFVRSYQEGRSQLGKVHRQASDLKRANDIYRKHASGELEEGVNVEDHIAAENKKAQDAEAERTKNETLASQEANIVLKTFKLDHADLGLDEDAIADIVGMASLSPSNNMTARLEFGLKRYLAVQAKAKTGMVKSQQDDMKKNADLGPGSSAGGKSTDGPDWSGMSSEDFQKHKREIQSR
jgi:hypothetical protein